ncbi:helix-turn-helix domain-containing protein [Tepidibacter mesophilus]|uniref:helix-turn-helix domain-containing protein n=1 Tax=Tepidibacter mesophilus TaxID=655607 RepID=UPI001FA8B173|nr:helix-turn-helix transcriptional regulator [Tepidibacter mesophilus]
MKNLREESNLKQVELAQIFTDREFNISSAAISQYESNKRVPDNTVLAMYADYFNVSIDYILGRTNLRNFQETTIAAHRTDGYDDLPPEAMEELERFKEFLRHKYKK